MLSFLAFSTAVLVTVFNFSELTPDDLVESPVLSYFSPFYLIPLVLLTVAGLLSQRRSRIQLDPEGGGVKWTWSAFVPYKSRREVVDLSAVHEVRLDTGARTARFLTSGVGAKATSEERSFTTRRSWMAPHRGCPTAAVPTGGRVRLLSTLPSASVCRCGSPTTTCALPS